MWNDADFTAPTDEGKGRNVQNRKYNKSYTLNLKATVTVYNHTADQTKGSSPMAR